MEQITPMGEDEIGASTLDQTGLSEAELISRARELEPQAWDTIYDAYYPRMYSFLYAHLGDRATAEDLAAEVFAQACRGIQRFQYRGVPLSAWLYRIARNVMADFLKQRRRLPIHLFDPSRPPEPTAPDLAEQVGARDQLVRALQRLTREQQQVLILRHIEGNDVASTARIMGKKENAIRALEFRALHSLRRILSQEEPKTP